MKADSANTEQLLEKVQQGDTSASEELFKRHQGRLLGAIKLRLDRRLAARVGVSDVLQDTYLEAARRMPQYLKQRKMPFYAWLRWIAREKIITLHRRYRKAQKRDVDREVPLLPPRSSAKFAASLLSREPSPSQKLASADLAAGLRKGLERLTNDDREIVLLRDFEQLSNEEAAGFLEITHAAARKRYDRALKRLSKRLRELGISKSR